MTTITQADRDAVNAFHNASFTALFDDGGDKQTVGGNINKAHTLLLEAFAAHREAAEARVVGEITKRFDHIRSDLNNISRAIEDEGDRCYLGSTNDADELRRVAQEFEDWLLACERGDHRSNDDAE